MNKILVWDLPIRVFHWVFAGSLTGALAIGWAVDDDNRFFPLHMLFGLLAVFALLVRIVLGLGGSFYNRFGNFPLRPAQIGGYFRGQFKGERHFYVGHNPGAALAAVAMFVLVPALVLTGFAARIEALQEIHEVLALLLGSVIGAHLFGLFTRRFRDRQPIVTPMLTGFKEGPSAASLWSTETFLGIIILVVTLAWAVALFSDYDASTRTVRLPVLDWVLPLNDERGGVHYDH